MAFHAYTSKNALQSIESEKAKASKAKKELNGWRWTPRYGYMHVGTTEGLTALQVVIPIFVDDHVCLDQWLL